MGARRTTRPKRLIAYLYNKVYSSHKSRTTVPRSPYTDPIHSPVQTTTRAQYPHKQGKPAHPKYKVGAAIKTIGTSAFANTKLGGLDLSDATSLVEIRDGAFSATDLGGTLVIPAKVTTIGYHAFKGTKLTGVDLERDLFIN